MELPGVQEGEDIIDWVRTGGNDKTKLGKLIKATPKWTPEKEGVDILSSLESWSHIQGLDIKVEWAVDRLIPKESITLIFGKGGIGKTWLTLDIARCIGSGLPFLGLKTTKSQVVFIDFENPLAVLNDRTQRLGDAKDVYFWRAFNDNIKAPKLDSQNWELYKKLPRGAVLIFDTLRASQGRDENASDQMGLIMGRLKELRDMGFTIILLHHTAKNSDKVAKGSTAIVDLADHILGLTLVKKKRDGQDVVVDDEDEEEDTVYRFGVREKTRFEPYHIYLTLNPDRGFEIAPDPQEDTLKKMYEILIEHGILTKGDFVNDCKEKGLGIAVNKLRKLVEIGRGRYWDIERRKDQRNAQFVIPKIQFFSFTDLYKGVKLKNCQDSFTEGDREESIQSPDNTKLFSFSEGGCKTEKLDLIEGII